MLCCAAGALFTPLDPLAGKGLRRDVFPLVWGCPHPSLHPLHLAPPAALMVPSRHLWLGNITQKPTDEQVLEVFATFGKVDSGACCATHSAGSARCTFGAGLGIARALGCLPLAAS